jgi:hypothetical protein
MDFRTKEPEAVTVNARSLPDAVTKILRATSGVIPLSIIHEKGPKTTMDAVVYYAIPYEIIPHMPVSQRPVNRGENLDR